MMNTITPYQNVLEQFQKDDTPPWYGVAARKLFYVAAFLTGERQSSNKYNLSPLHVAVMTGDLSTTEAFLKKGCNPNAKDHKGWTPLHHAALISKQMMTLLISFNASGTITNTNEGVPADLFNMANAPTIPLKHPIYALTENGKEEEITREEFRVRTGATYIEHPYIPAEDQVNLWMRYSDPSVVDLTSEYETFLRNPPKIALTTESPKDENGNKLPIGRSVITLEDIPKGAIITPYNGRHTEEDDITCGDHKLFTMDGERFRNLGPHLADGFPNAYVDICKAAHGALPVVIIALELIPKGSPITLDYVMHHCKWGGRTEGKTEVEVYRLSHLELRPNSLLAAVRERSIAKPIQSLDFRIISTVGYILNTPSALTTLLLSGEISIDKVQEAMCLPRYCMAGAIENEEQFMFPALQQILRPKYTLAKECVLEASKRGRVQLTANLLDIFSHNAKSFEFPAGPLSQFFGKLLDEGKELEAVNLFMKLHLCNQIAFTAISKV